MRTNTDDAEDNDDTSLTLGPVLALDELASDEVAGNDLVDGGHCSGSLDFERGEGDGPDCGRYRG